MHAAVPYLLDIRPADGDERWCAHCALPSAVEAFGVITGCYRWLLIRWYACPQCLRSWWPDG